MLKAYRYLLSAVGSGSQALIVFAKNPGDADKTATKFAKSLHKDARVGKPTTRYEYDIKEGGCIQS